MLTISPHTGSQAWSRARSQDIGRQAGTEVMAVDTEVMAVDEETAYESPELVAIGTFDEDTRGWWGAFWDGPSGTRD